jgi:hypothetical protein
VKEKGPVWVVQRGPATPLMTVTCGRVLMIAVCDSLELGTSGQSCVGKLGMTWVTERVALDEKLGGQVTV